METIERTLSLERAQLDLEARTVPVTVATDRPIRGYVRNEILSHEDGAVDLTGATKGLPLLVAHNGAGLPVGRVEHLAVSKGETRGVARLGRSELAESVLRDIADGILTDVSVGAEILEWDQVDEETRIARAWRPREVSLVAMGADPLAKIHRAEVKKMAFELASDAAPETVNRTEEIGRLFAGLSGERWKDMQIAALTSQDSIEVIRTQVLDELKASSKPVQSDFHAQPGEDGREKFARTARSVLQYRIGRYAEGEDKLAVERDARSSEHFGSSLMDLARSYCRVNNIDLTGKSRAQIADTVLRHGIISHSGGDFSNLVADTANKSLAVAYEETPTTWQDWCATGSLPDFKQADIVNTSSFSDLDRIRNDEEYQYGTAADKKETATMRRYGKLLSLGRTLLINDDLMALDRMAAQMGRAAARQVNNDVYAILNDNAAMNEDSNTLFDSTNHGNNTAGAGAPTVANLDIGFTAMGTQNALGPDGGAQTGAVLNLRPEFLIVPKALEVTARTLVAAAKDPAEGGTTSFDSPNPFQGSLRVVADAVLDGTSTVAWYLACSPRQIDTVTVFFLNGVQTPYMEQQDGFTRDGIILKVRHEFVAQVLDFRGLWKKDGA